MTDKKKELRIARSVAMRQLGFGPDVMKETKVCPVCGATANAFENECIHCGADLPAETLFDLYKSQHQFCAHCGTVVADRSVFCPECGMRLRHTCRPLRTEVG